jgi:shikimate kinase
MGVGKSSVARHLSKRLGVRQIDLDLALEKSEGRTVAQIIDTDGEAAFRAIETRNLENVLADTELRILSLGGGTWTIEKNREIIRASGYTSVWLETTFQHCWLNITFSRKDRPLARNKKRAIKLFDERQAVYCLADWHFNIRPGFNSYQVAGQIIDQVFS